MTAAAATLLGQNNWGIRINTATGVTMAQDD
jgi:hypothetical protein